MCTPDGSGVRETGDLVGDLVATAERLWQQGQPAVRSGTTSGLVPDDLIRLRRACNLIELEFSRLASALAQSDEWELDGYVSPISWLRENCEMTGAAASAAIDVGSQASHLGESFAALEDGEIGFRHLSMLAGTIDSISRNHPNFPINENVLLDKAKVHSVAHFRHDCDHIRHAADEKELLRPGLDAVEARSLELKPSESGCYFVRGFLDGEGGATVRTALEALARPADAADTRNRNRRLADALIELSHHALDAALVPIQQTVRPHLQLTVSLETLARLEHSPAAELQYTTPISATVAQRLTCDATVRRVVLDAKSAVIDVGRAQRIAGPALRNALAVRDKGCIWPGCDRPPSWTAAHHLRHWAQGGKTDLANLVLICHRHHRMAHEGGWQLARATDGEIVVTRVPTDALRAERSRLLHVSAGRQLMPAARSPDLVPA